MRYMHLLKGLREDRGLRTELHAVEQEPQALVRWARAKGYELSEKEAKDLLESLQELSDDELDKVAGGEDAWGGAGGASGTGGTGGTGGGTTTPPP